MRTGSAPPRCTGMRRTCSRASANGSARGDSDPELIVVDKIEPGGQKAKLLASGNAVLDPRQH